jgi:hypothetical protein
MVLGIPLTVLADDDDDRRRLTADPFIFVGKAGDCGAGYPAGSNIVTSAWLGGMGLPDNGGPNSNPANATDNPNKRDAHFGLLLSKNGPTPDCSAAGAEIKGVKGMVVTNTFALGFDYRNGSHCGGGAPRFNVVTRIGSSETFHFVGNCAVGINTPAEQDPQWTTIRFSAAVASPPILLGSRIESISLIFDEGTDQPSPVPATSGDISGIGLAVVDNIFVSGRFIRRGNGIEPKSGERGRDND